MKKWFFSKKCKVFIAGITVICFFVGLIPPALAETKGQNDYNAAVYIQKEFGEDGRQQFHLMPDKTNRKPGVDIEKVVFDDSMQMFHSCINDRVYYIEDRAGDYFQLEKTVVKDELDLKEASERYELSERETNDMVKILKDNPKIQLLLFAPASNESYGTYSGKSYRYVCVRATEPGEYYTLASGVNIQSAVINTAFYAISQLGSRANLGVFFTTTILGLANIEYQFRSDSNCSVTKSEIANFQYIDFYELGTMYINRGLNSYGSVTMTPKTRYWKKMSDGSYYHDEVIGSSVTKNFGTTETPYALAQKSYLYFEDYSEYGTHRYEKYTTMFKANASNSVPAITPMR